MLVIPAHVPHIFRFLNDTVMGEWWDEAFETRYYRPYRRVVDAALRARQQANRAERRQAPARAMGSATERAGGRTLGGRMYRKQTPAASEPHAAR
jgi:hypothetical protein